MDDRLEKIWQDLKTQRDELRVQIHLAQSEVREELEALEPKWQAAQENLADIKEDTEDAAQDVKVALNVIAEELSSAYQNIKSRLHKD